MMQCRFEKWRQILALYNFSAKRSENGILMTFLGFILGQFTKCHLVTKIPSRPKKKGLSRSKMLVLTLFGVVWVAAYRQETKGCRRTWRATILCRWVCKVTPSTWRVGAWTRQRYWRPHRADMKWSWLSDTKLYITAVTKLESWQSRGQGYPAAWFSIHLFIIEFMLFTGLHSLPIAAALQELLENEGDQQQEQQRRPR